MLNMPSYRKNEQTEIWHSQNLFTFKTTQLVTFNLVSVNLWWYNRSFFFLIVLHRKLLARDESYKWGFFAGKGIGTRIRWINKNFLENWFFGRSFGHGSGQWQITGHRKRVPSCHRVTRCHTTSQSKFYDLVRLRHGGAEGKHKRWKNILTLEKKFMKEQICKFVGFFLASSCLHGNSLCWGLLWWPVSVRRHLLHWKQDDEVVTATQQNCDAITGEDGP